MRNLAICKRFAVVAELSSAWRHAGWSVSEFREAGELSSLPERPSFVFDVNFHEELHAACVELGMPYLVWSFDSGVADAILRTAKKSLRSTDFFFLFNSQDVKRLSSYHQNVWHLPFSAGDEFMRAPGASPIKFDVLIVMNSYRDSVFLSEKRFEETLLASSDEFSRKKLVLIKNIMDEAVRRHADILSEDRMPLIVEELIAACGFNPFEENASQKDSLCQQYGQILSSRQRETCLRLIASGGRKVSLYGDRNWLEIANGLPNVSWNPPCAYSQLPDLYNAAKINVNLTQIQNLGSVPQRIFHLLAAGAFTLSNASEELESIFKGGVHLETFSSWSQLDDLVAYYLGHEEERLEIARRGHEEFLSRHRLANRLSFILKNTAL